MNGPDIDRVEQVFKAKLEPLTAAVNDLTEKSEKHYKEIIIMKEKFKLVGNCLQHTAEVNTVKRDIKIVDGKTATNSNRIWGLVLLLLFGAIGLIAKVLAG